MEDNPCISANELASRSSAFITSSCEGIGLINVVKEKTAEYLKQKGRDVSRLIVIGSGLASNPATVVEFYIHLFRKYSLHRSERETILGASDQMIAVQLVLAAQNKKKLGDFCVDASNVLNVYNKLILWKLSPVTGSHLALSEQFDEANDADFSEFLKEYNNFLQHCNVVDWMDVTSSVTSELKINMELQNLMLTSDFLLLNPRGDFIERTLIHELAKEKECFNISLSLSLNDSFSQTVMPHSVEFAIEKCSVEDILPCLNAAGKTTASISEVYTDRIFLAYLELLVNSRNELALALVINIPDRNLDHFAFTDIKHEAKSRNISMHQAIISFVMRMKLGGKSYAPTNDCPLVRHAEGLRKFSDMMEKLQTIIEEELVTESAIRRVLNIIKVNITQHNSQQLKTDAVDKTVAQLLEQARIILHAKVISPDVTPTHNASDGATVIGRRTLRIMRTLLDHKFSLPLSLHSIDILTDAFSTSQKTPVRFPSLMSKFRSPEEYDEPEIVQPLTKRISVDAKLSKPKLSVQSRSYFDWAVIDSSSAHCSLTSEGLSKMMIKRNCTKRILESDKDQENTDERRLQLQQPAGDIFMNQTVGTSAIKAKKQQKISADKEKPTATQKETHLNMTKKPIKLKQAKIKNIPVIKGQQKLNNFFRLG